MADPRAFTYFLEFCVGHVRAEPVYGIHSSTPPALLAVGQFLYLSQWNIPTVKTPYGRITAINHNIFATDGGAPHQQISIAFVYVESDEVTSNQQRAASEDAPAPAEGRLMVHS